LIHAGIIIYINLGEEMNKKNLFNFKKKNSVHFIFLAQVEFGGWSYKPFGAY